MHALHALFATRRRQDVWLCVLLMALGWLYFWRLLTPVEANQQSFVEGDFSGQFVAFAQYQAERLAQGHIPLWNPYNMGGHPFLADTQSAVFYPPRLLTIAWLNSTGGSTPGRMYDALQKEVVAHTVLASLLMYAFLRTLTHMYRYSLLASLLGALTWAYGGYLTSYPQLQVAVMEAGIWLPLGWLAVRAAVLAFASRRWAVGLGWLAIAGLALGLSFLAGHPQTTLFFLYALLAWLGWQAYQQRLVWPLVLLSGLLVAGIGGGLAAVQLLPGLEYLGQTTRDLLSFEARGNGFPIYDLMQFLIAGSVSLWSPLYSGAVGLMLVVMAFRRWQREYWFWLGLGLFALLLSFGLGSILYDLTYLLLPGTSLFRGQERSAYLVALCMAVMVSYGVLVLADQMPSVRWQRLWWVILIVLATVFTVLFISWEVAPQQVASPRLELAGLAVLVAALVAVLLGARLPPVHRLGWLSALLVFELFSVGRFSPNLRSVPPQRMLAASPLVHTIQADQTSIFRSEGLGANFGTAYGLLDPEGISPLRLANVDRLLKRLPANRRRELFAVRYVITSDRELTQPSQVIAETGEGINTLRLHQLVQPRPMVRLVYRVWVEANADQAIGYISDPAFDAKQIVMLNEPPQVPDPSQNRSANDNKYYRKLIPLELPTMPIPAQAVPFTVFTPERMVVQVDTPHNSLLEIAVPDYVGWQATVDGQSVPILRADTAFMAISLMAGVHTVELNFQPHSYAIGQLLSLATLVVCVGLGAIGLIRARKGRVRA